MRVKGLHVVAVQQGMTDSYIQTKGELRLASESWAKHENGALKGPDRVGY
jgi:hypothetical protein